MFEKNLAWSDHLSRGLTGPLGRRDTDNADKALSDILGHCDTCDRTILSSTLALVSRFSQVANIHSSGVIPAQDHE